MVFSVYVTEASVKTVNHSSEEDSYTLNCEVRYQLSVCVIASVKSGFERVLRHHDLLFELLPCQSQTTAKFSMWQEEKSHKS